MPVLIRRRSPHHRQQCWEVYFGDVHVGTIAERTGNPTPSLGNGGAASIPARALANALAARRRHSPKRAPISKTAWKVFLSNRSEADFQEWRNQEAWTAEKYRRFDRGERMPPDWGSLDAGGSDAHS
jgi:hypothetical protein